MQTVHLQVTLKVADSNRAAAADAYRKYKTPFLDIVNHAKSKELLVRDKDVQVLHGFDTEENANACLQSALFTQDVDGALQPLLATHPDVRVYTVV